MAAMLTAGRCAADVEIDDSPLGSFLFGTQQKGDLRNYMRFTVTVDGKAVTRRLRQVARLYGQDVTARLKGGRNVGA